MTTLLLAGLWGRATIPLVAEMEARLMNITDMRSVLTNYGFQTG